MLYQLQLFLAQDNQGRQGGHLPGYREEAVTWMLLNLRSCTSLSHRTPQDQSYRYNLYLRRKEVGEKCVCVCVCGRGGEEGQSILLYKASLIPRPSLATVFDHLQYAKLEPRNAVGKRLVQGIQSLFTISLDPRLSCLQFSLLAVRDVAG